MGIQGYNDKTETEWLRELTAKSIDNFEAFRESGVARFPKPADAVAFAAEIRGERPFSTPSGRIEIYSSALAAKPDPYGLGKIDPIPTWTAPPADPAFPLLLCSPKSRARTHSIHGNQPSLARVDPDTVWINPDDAAVRGIIKGQRVLRGLISSPGKFWRITNSIGGPFGFSWRQMMSFWEARTTLPN